MALIRKATLVFSEILLLVAATAFLMLPEYVIDAVEILADLNYWLRLVIVVIIFVLIVLAVIAQLRGAERYRGAELTVQAGDSNTTVTAESLRQRLQRGILDLSDIETVECEVKGQGGKALINMGVMTSKDEINIPEKQREIDRVIKLIAVKQMGVQLAEPAVINIRLASDTGEEAAEPEKEVVSVAPVVSPPALVTPEPAPVIPVVDPVAVDPVDTDEDVTED